ncbi:hypothetical protein Aperf_G00000100094 [Anoplocephala perfoliata]
MRSNRTSKHKRRNGEQYFQVEAILDERRVNNQLSFKVRWVGYPSSADTWEPEEHLSGVRNLIEEFHAQKQNLSSLHSQSSTKRRTGSSNEPNPSKSHLDSPSLCKRRMNKSRSGYYEYVPQSQLVAFKTQFFSDINEGKVDLTSDLYSRVKNRRRHHQDESLSRPSSLSEMSDYKISASAAPPTRHSEPPSPKKFIHASKLPTQCPDYVDSCSSEAPPSESRLVKESVYSPSISKPVLKRQLSSPDPSSSTLKRPLKDTSQNLFADQDLLDRLKETETPETSRQSSVSEDKVGEYSDGVAEDVELPKPPLPSVQSMQKLMSIYRDLHESLSWGDKDEDILSQLPIVKAYTDNASIRSLDDLIFAINNHHWTLLATHPIEKTSIVPYPGSQHPLVAALIGGEGRPFLLRRLLQTVSGPNFVDPISNWPLLVIAVFYGRIQAVQVLLELGADPNLFIQVDGKQRTALGVAIATGNVDMVSLLVLGGANLYKVNGDMTSLQFIDKLIIAVLFKTPHEALVKLPAKYGIDKNAARQQYIALARDSSYIPPIEAPDDVYLPRSPYLTSLTSSTSGTPTSTSFRMSFDGQMSKLPSPDSLQCIHRLISSLHARLFVAIDQIVSQWLQKVEMATVSVVEKGQWLCLHNDSFTVTFPTPRDDFSSVFVLFLIHGTITPPGCYNLWLGDDGPCFVDRVLLGSVEQKPLDRLFFVSTLLPLNRSEENQSIFVFLNPKRQKGVCIIPLVLRLRPVIKNTTTTGVVSQMNSTGDDIQSPEMPRLRQRVL